MKNAIKWFCIIALAAVMGFGFTACEGPAGPAGKDGADGINGADGRDGTNGTNGTDATISSVITIQNGTWWIDGEDTGMAVKGEDGRDGVNGAAGASGTLDSVLTVGGNGNWYIDGEDTGKEARGLPGNDGADGENGTKVEISAEGTWVLDGVDTGTPVTGADGKDGANGSLSSVLTIDTTSGNWVIDGVDTGVRAGGGGDNSCAVSHDYSEWKIVMPITNIVNLREAHVCAVCGGVEPNSERYAYINLKTWLDEQSDYGSGTLTDPVEIVLQQDLGDLEKDDSDGKDVPAWFTLMEYLDAANKFANLDLSYCTFTNGTNPGHFTGAFGGAGRSKVTSIVLPVAAGNVRDFTNTFSSLSSVSGTGVTTLGGNDFTCFQNIFNFTVSLSVQ